MSHLKVACIQMRTGVSPEENRAVMDELVRQAASQGARYVQTPEMTGLLERGRERQIEKARTEAEDMIFAAAGGLARELDIWLHVGSTAIALDEDRLANRAGMFSPAGDLVATYDKIHMFDVDLDNGESWRESRTYRPGNAAKLLDTGEFRLGFSICYDLRFPHLYREMAKAGAQILACPAAFTRQTGKAHWHILLRSRAIENGAWVIAAAQGGEHEDGRTTYGHSLVINPWGETVAELDHDEPGVLVAEIDLDEVKRARSKVPNLLNGQSFELVSSVAGQKG